MILPYFSGSGGTSHSTAHCIHEDSEFRVGSQSLAFGNHLMENVHVLAD